LKISVTIRFDGEPKFTPSSRILVRLLDVSLADSPSKIIVEKEIKPKGKPRYSLDLALNAVDSKASYIVDVWVDVDGKGPLEVGDFITMQSYPVLTYGHPVKVDVVVNEVKS
jgi:uncharacterized lipoprotein YbaY